MLEYLRISRIEMITMKIVAPEHLLDTTQLTHARQTALDGGVAEDAVTLLVEHMLEVSIQDVPVYRLVCSPTQLPELVLGRLLSEGVISGADDVDVIYLCKDGLRAKVFLKEQRKLETAPPRVETVASCCTGNRTLADVFSAAELPPRVQPIAYRPEWIFSLARAMNSGTPLYAATHSAHSCLLQCQGTLLTSSEDIGRHNAMDKVIGWALCHGVDLKSCILYTSGRVPVDMALKAIQAGVPVLASKALPTDKAVELAKEFGLTLIGAAHPDSMRVFTER